MVEIEFESKLPSVRLTVPGLERVMEDFRAAYPELSQEMIRRVLRLPPEGVQAPTGAREV